MFLRDRFFPIGVIFAALLLCACSLVGGYNASALQQLTELQAEHDHFLQQFSVDSGPTLDVSALASADRALSGHFEQAIAQSVALGDALRTDTLEQLDYLYAADHATLMRQQRPFSRAQLTLAQAQDNDAWQRAIRGEMQRQGGDHRGSAQ